MKTQKNEKHLTDASRERKKMIGANRNNQDDYIKVLKELKEGTHIYNVLLYLMKNGSITNLDAVMLDYNTRLSASIKELRDRWGVEIITEREEKTNGGWYGRYTLG